MDGQAQITAITAKLVIALVLFAGAVLGIYFAISVSEGRTMVPYMVMAPIIGGTIGLLMGKNYWLLIPIGFSVKLPAFPLMGRVFELPEVVIMGATTLYVARLCLKHEKLDLARFCNTGVYLYAGWCFWVLYQNPVGFSSMGADAGGLRFYLKIFLAFTSFIVISNQTISAKQAKWIIWSMVTGAFLSFGWSIVQNNFLGGGTVSAISDDGEGEYTIVSQAMSGLGFTLILYIVSRYRMNEIFSLKRPWLLLILAASGVFGLMGGKRAAMASATLLPILAGIIRRQYGYVLFFIFSGALFLSTLVVGHGNYFELPYGVQRSLANLPGDWDRKVYNETRGVFRKELREFAVNQIQKDYIYGKKGFRIDLDEIINTIGYDGFGGNAEMIAGHALSSNWHNTWLGIAADFGVPASVFWGVYVITVLVFGRWAYKKYPEKDWRFILGMMLYISFITIFLRSWTSGHSALNPFDQWWMYGVLIALLYNKDQSQDTSQQQTSPETRPAAVTSGT